MRCLLMVLIMLVSTSATAEPRNVYFESASKPSIQGTCILVKVSSPNNLYHCLYSPIIPGTCIAPTEVGPKRIEELTVQEKATMGYLGEFETGIPAKYKKNGDLKHAFAGVPAYENQADKTAKKDKYKDK